MGNKENTRTRDQLPKRVYSTEEFRFVLRYHAELFCRLYDKYEDIPTKQIILVPHVAIFRLRDSLRNYFNEAYTSSEKIKMDRVTRENFEVNYLGQYLDLSKIPPKTKGTLFYDPFLEIRLEFLVNHERKKMVDSYLSYFGNEKDILPSYFGKIFGLTLVETISRNTGKVSLLRKTS